jgi:hypothetical protein
VRVASQLETNDLSQFAQPSLERSDQGGRDCRAPFGFVSMVDFLSLPERPAYGHMQCLGQPLDHVASSCESLSVGSVCGRRRLDK